MDPVTPTIPQEGDPVFPDPGEGNTPAAPSAEIKPAETPAPSADPVKPDVKAVPFNEDPKVQEYINRQVETRVSKSLQEKFAPQADPSIPSWFGGDAKAWADFQGYIGNLKGEAKAEALREIEAKKDAEQKAVQEASDWFETSVKEIEATGEKVDRNKLMKFVYDNEIVDSKGRWNYKKGYEFMTLAEKANAAPSTLGERKQIAANAAPDPKPGKPQRDYATPADLRNVW
jgi:hypothetical protein